MNVVQIISHPDSTGKSFTHELSKSFRFGAEDAGARVHTHNLFSKHIKKNIIDDIFNADHICFAWPCWWEMPPAKLVDFFQTVFVRGFAFDKQYDLANDQSVVCKMVPILNLNVTCLISLGQDKDHNTDNLNASMLYCGLHPKFHLFKNVGPDLPFDLAEEYLDQAYRAGVDSQKPAST